MTAQPTVTVEQVAKHATMQDCWVIIHGYAYDITSFLEDHPGGPDVVLQDAGRDATEEFENMFHSMTARKMLDEYLVGPVEGMEQKDAKEMLGGVANVSKSSGSSSASMLIYALPLMFAVGVYVYQTISV